MLVLAWRHLVPLPLGYLIEQPLDWMLDHRHAAFWQDSRRLGLENRLRFCLSTLAMSIMAELSKRKVKTDKPCFFGWKGEREEALVQLCPKDFR